MAWGSEGSIARELDRQFTVCPFHVAHVIKKSHFHRHLIKCKNNHSESKKIVCPFDASEYVSAEKYGEHIRTCNKKDLVNWNPAVQNTNSRIRTPLVKHECFTDGENWDDEEAEYKMFQ